MGVMDWLFGRSDSHNQNAKGDGNYQYQDNSVHFGDSGRPRVTMCHREGGMKCPYNGYCEMCGYYKALKDGDYC
ncbi:hypothetical protein FACS1894217_13380 [Clostridia bacterium]|nr:hypothetical protein FACS1894217_13380 [Clostridia bacterium]